MYDNINVTKSMWKKSSFSQRELAARSDIVSKPYYILGETKYSVTLYNKWESRYIFESFFILLISTFIFFLFILVLFVGFYKISFFLFVVEFYY